MNKVSLYIILLFLLFTLAISCKGQIISTGVRETQTRMSAMVEESRQNLMPMIEKNTEC